MASIPSHDIVGLHLFVSEISIVASCISPHFRSSGWYGDSKGHSVPYVCANVPSLYWTHPVPNGTSYPAKCSGGLNQNKKLWVKGSKFINLDLPQTRWNQGFPFADFWADGPGKFPIHQSPASSRGRLASGNLAGKCRQIVWKHKLTNQLPLYHHLIYLIICRMLDETKQNISNLQIVSSWRREFHNLTVVC